MAGMSSMLRASVQPFTAVSAVDSNDGALTVRRNLEISSPGRPGLVNCAVTSDFKGQWNGGKQFVGTSKPGPCLICSNGYQCGRGLVIARSAVGGKSVRGRRSSKKEAAVTDGAKEEKEKKKDKVVHVHTRQELEEALKAAGTKLAVVEYGASDDEDTAKIYPAIVQLSKDLKAVVFIEVVVDESEETKALCAAAGVEKCPTFVFYRNMEEVHREEGIDSEQLIGDVLYYGDNDAPIHQIRSKEDVESLLAEHESDHKLVVVDVSLKDCTPCVRVYPTVVNLSQRMSDFAVFARIVGDENEACTQLLRDMDVKQVPTFLFIRDGKLCGRYVGSGKGELIGEILRYQGVKVT